MAWAFMGLCWIAMGLWTHPPVIALMGALSGTTVVLGIAAISVLITSPPEVRSGGRSCPGRPSS
jgi:hypothetical protein